MMESQMFGGIPKTIIQSRFPNLILKENSFYIQVIFCLLWNELNPTPELKLYEESEPTNRGQNQSFK